MHVSSEMTRVVELIENGDPSAKDELVSLTYGELKRIAAQMMASERPGHTLQATALVHEAYIRVFGGKPDSQQQWNSRGHFFSALAEAMRRVLIDSARRRLSAKRGNDPDHTEWEESKVVADTPDEQLEAIDEALDRLEEFDPELAKVVKLRYFVGMTVPETAEALGISPRTVNRNWKSARAWLYREVAME